MIWCMLDQVEKMAMLFYGGVFTSRIPLNSLLPSMRNKEYTVTTWISGWHYYHSCQGAGAKSCIFGFFFSLPFSVVVVCWGGWGWQWENLTNKSCEVGHHFEPVQCAQTLAAILQLGNHFENVFGKLSEFADTV